MRYITLLLLLFLPLFVRGQFVDYGTDPARLKWKYVSTPHYKVIFPEGNDSLAYRYTAYLENVYPHLSKTIGEPVKAKFPVVLHGGNMLSNGLVAWAPRRMELITTPSSSLYAQNWDRQLVIHESRHVLQTGKLMKGIFRPLYYITGEQITGVSAFAVPKWFFEGDAVVTETAMSNSGRGRLPEFNMYYRTQYLTGDFYSFDKWFIGSYKDYTGNFYALGYDMAAYARHAYGADIWDKVTDRYTRRILHLPPFSKALKQYTGLKNTNALFKETFEFLGKEWTEQDKQLNLTAHRFVSPEEKHFTNYQYPQWWRNSSVIAVRSGLRDINHLVLIQNGYVKRLTYLGNLSSRIILNGDRVYWTEYVSGLRWTHENHSVLKYYDLRERKVHTLTPRQRYLAPAISPDGKLAALSEYAFNGTNRIVVVDTRKGDVEAVYPTPDNVFMKELAYGEAGKLYGIAIGDAGLSVLELETSSGKWNVLIEPGSANITSLSFHGGELLFESGLSGVNNIYSFDIVNRVAKRRTESRFGVFMPDISETGEELIFSGYQPGGYRISSMKLNDTFEENADFSDPYRFTLAETVTEQEGFNLDTATLAPVTFEPRPYRKPAHLFNIHSWAPFYYDVTEAVNMNADDFSTIIKPGAMFISQNHLNTAITQLGYYYRNGNHHGKLSFVYMGWYPVIDLTVDYGDKAFDMRWRQGENGRMTTELYATNRNQVELEARMYVPFNFTKNHWVRGFQPSLTYYLTNNQYQQIKSGEMRNFQYLLSEVRYYQYRRMASRDILPRWGYQLRLQYLNLPFNTENYGNLYTGRLTTYWPGVMRNHSLMVRLGYQYQDVDSKALYIPKRLLETPRGYNYNYRSRQQLALKADYAFSLFCPDFSLGPWAYIKRVRTNLFYDLSRTQAEKNGGWINQSSTGIDLIADWSVFRLNYPISLGVRLIAPINYGNVQAEALFSMSF